MNDFEDFLQHYGVKGMKWGVRRYQPYPKGKKGKFVGEKKSSDTSNDVKLKNYKGKTYFISEHNMGGKTLNPRVPKNYFTDNGYEDSKTERISFAPSVDNALMGLSQNVTGKSFFVHEPEGKPDIYKPNTKAVPDANITGELWVKEPVKLKVVGEILVTNDAGKPGKVFTYGDKSAELYEFDYEWTTKQGVSDIDKVEDFLQHYGVKGMKWGVIRRRSGKGGSDGKVESSGGKKGKSSKEDTAPSETAKSKLGRKLDSMKREREWNKVLNNMDKMTSKDIKDVTKRIQLENDLKRLSKAKVATTKDKEDYLRRNKMSDDELKRKVTRLKVKDGLHTQVKEASKEQRALGEKLTQIGGSLTIKYTLTKQKPEFKDVYNTIKNPKDSYGNAKSDLQKEAVNRINEMAKKQNKP